MLTTVAPVRKNPLIVTVVPRVPVVGVKDQMLGIGVEVYL